MNAVSAFLRRIEVAGFAEMLVRRWQLFALTGFTGILMTLVDAFGVAVVVPLLTVQGVNPLQRVPLLGPLVQALLERPKEELVGYVAGLLILTALLRGGAAVGYRFLLEAQRESHEIDLRERVVDQLLAVEPHYLENEKIGNLGTILVGHVAIAAAVAERLTGFVSALFQMGVIVLIMLLISARLTLVALGLLGIAFWIVQLKSASWLHALSKEANAAIVETQQNLIEMTSNIRSVHYLGIAGAMRARALEQIHRYARAQKWRMIGLGLVSPLFTMAIGIVIGLLLLIAASAYDDVNAPIATVLALLLMLTRLIGPAAAITDTASYMSSSWHQVGEVMRFLDAGDKPYLPEGSLTAPDALSDIRFEGVTFQYPRRDVGVYDFDLDIRAGSVTALAGASGSGKSTLVSLLARLFDPACGRILFAGQDIRSFQLESWRSRLAVVSQDNIVVNGTIADNLRLVAPRATDAAIRSALDAAGASEFVGKLAGGIETRLGDRGMNLSGGQRQRLSIARAILSRRQIIVLDEATSQLDVDTEQLIQETIERLRGAHTIILVAHRLTTIRTADMIYLMADGRAVGNGTHAELLATNALYKHYVELQSFQPNAAVTPPAAQR